MPGAHMHRNVTSPAGSASRRSKKELESEDKKRGSRSMKKLVRSLSDRYAAVTSPLTCKKKTACHSRAPFLKTMRTTAATSLLPLKPAFSVSCRSIVQPSAPRTDSLTFFTQPTNMSCLPEIQSASTKSLLSSPAGASYQRTSSTPTSKTLLHVQPLARAVTPVLAPLRTQIDGRSGPTEGEPKTEMLFSSPAFASPLQLPNNSRGERTTSPGKNRLPDIGLYEALLLESSKSRHRQTSYAVEALLSGHKNRTKLERQKLEAILNHKDDEIERLRTAGAMLKEVCMKQDDEMKTLKAAFPSTLREVAELREACQKQEKELAYSRVALPNLQSQVASLSEQLRSLTEELMQTKALKEGSSEKVFSHFHDRETSQSSQSCLSIESSLLGNGFLEQIRQSRKGQSISKVGEDQESMPVQICEDASSSCSSVTSFNRTSEMLLNPKHKRGSSAVLSVEHMLKWNGRRPSSPLPIDKDFKDTLQDLNIAADREQALLQASSFDGVKELRTCSSRFATLEPIKSILTCASPQPHEECLGEVTDINHLPERSMWNLKPT